MQIKLDTLRHALEVLEPVVPKRPTLPVLSHVLLRNGQAIATDLETGVMVQLPEADDEALIPCRPVLAMLKRTPGYEMLTIGQESSKLTISWSAGKAIYQTLKPADFPGMHGLPEGTQMHTVDGDILVKTLVSLLPFVAKEDTRPVLSGITVYLGDQLDAWAADGFRLAHQVMNISLPPDGMDMVIIPSRAVELLQHVWERTPRTPTGSSIVEIVTAKRMVDLGISALKLGLGSRLVARFGPVTMVINLIEGTPPNFAQLVPKEERAEVRFMAPDLERAVRRARDIAHDGSGKIHLSWTTDTMSVAAKGGDNEVETSLGANAQQPGKVAIDVKYLLSYLAGKDGLVSMAAGEDANRNGPVLFRYGKTPLVLIMPMMDSAPTPPAPAQDVAAEAPPGDEEATTEGAPEEETIDAPEDIQEPPEPQPADEPTPPKKRRRRQPQKA